MHKKEKRVAKWHKIRELGMVRYIFLYGLCLYGINMSILIYVLRILFKSEPQSLYDSIILGMVIGISYGIVTWKHNEKEYTEIK